MSKPNVLISGGIGMVGRNLVKFLVDKDLCASIRVVDKALPATSFMSKIHQDAFDSDVVEFIQGDLSREATVNKAFDGKQFNYVINLAAEGKYGQSEEVYSKKILDVAKAVGAKAKDHGVEKFIEVSHAGVYEPKSKGSDESGTLKPWTKQSNFKLQAEEHLKGLGLPLVVLRPAMIYGLGDIYGISPRLICARVYKHLNKKMKFLWTKDLKLNTVHVDDVCKAIWHGCINLDSGSVYNLADKSDTTQGSLNEILEKIFQIETGFQGNMISNMAKLNMRRASEEINDMHMQPWSEVCQSAGILNTPLTPYLDIELLYNNHLSVVGSSIEGTGFSYDHPNLTADGLRVQLNDYISNKLFPAFE